MWQTGDVERTRVMRSFRNLDESSLKWPVPEMGWLLDQSVFVSSFVSKMSRLMGKPQPPIPQLSSSALECVLGFTFSWHSCLWFQLVARSRYVIMQSC